jgi:hypothetical protein
MTENDNKYAEDKTDPELNLSALDELFDTLPKEALTEEEFQKREIESMRKELDILLKDNSDPDDIIHQNIERANRLLDIIETNVTKGKSSNRTFEVAGQLITAVTAAAASISGMGYNQQVLDQKSRDLERKEKELDLKRTIKTATGNPDETGDVKNLTQNNLIFTDRESLLSFINTSKDEEAELFPVKKLT